MYPSLDIRETPVTDRSWFHPLMSRSEVDVRDQIDSEFKAALRWYRQYRAQARQPHHGSYPEDGAREMRLVLRVLYQCRRAGLRKTGAWR